MGLRAKADPVAELWHRPWALVDLRRQHRVALEGGVVTIPADHRAGLWVYLSEGETARVDGREDVAVSVAGFAPTGVNRSLLLLPLPLRSIPGTLIEASAHKTQIEWPDAPERPALDFEPQTDKEKQARELMLRAEAVWDRLKEIDTVLADPANFWRALHRQWTQEGEHMPPNMDIIVRQVSELFRTLDELEKAPRHILKRTHQMVPISRVQELDRRSMMWLIRQPGETFAERAGDRQRIRSVAREENYDTLENRVLRSYAEHAHRTAKDYLERNRVKRGTRRARKVDEFGRRCKRLARELRDRGVRRAEPGVTPNFVLQQNPNYHAVWQAWLELLDHRRVLDDLWRWQARSWEEFCAIAVAVALVGMPGAQIIAAAPINFLDEQNRGSWVSSDNPLATFYLPRDRLVVEVRYRMNNPNAHLSDFGAPIWVRFGRTYNATGFLSNVPIWPIWDLHGGAPADEAAEIDRILSLGTQASIVGGIVLRPTDHDAHATNVVGTRALIQTIGTEGRALWDAISSLTHFLTSKMPESNR